MDIKTMERLERRLCAELDEIAEKNSMSPGDLDVIDKATHTLKSMATIKAMDGGQSQRGGQWNANGSYGNGNSQRMHNGSSYDDGMSYRRRRNSYSGSDGPDMMRDELRQMMDSGNLNSRQRSAASQLMDELDR